MKLFEGVKEKKVEYTELIYDLIFVYMIGRVNGLLQNIQGGFVAGASFLAYILCLLALIQIWNFSTYYVNMYGTNGVREHVFLFLNMFLLYFIGTSTKVHWQATQTRYHVAWALILLNIAVQYFIELNNHKCSPQEKKSILTVSIILVIESVIVLLGAFIHDTPGIYLSAAAILFGIVATHLTGGGSYTNVDFMHLTERAMLFVAFVIFAVLMFVFRNNMAVNILVSVLFVYLVFGVLHHFAKKVDG